MRNLFDVQQLLKRFGTFIYIGDRMADLDLMEEEIRALFDNKLISNEEFTKGLLIIRQERRKLQ